MGLSFGDRRQAEFRCKPALYFRHKEEIATVSKLETYMEPKKSRVNMVDFVYWFAS